VASREPTTTLGTLCVKPSTSAACSTWEHAQGRGEPVRTGCCPLRAC
jgi:hypothetical protein